VLGLFRAPFLGAQVTLLTSRAPLLSTIRAASFQSSEQGSHGLTLRRSAMFRQGLPVQAEAAVHRNPRSGLFRLDNGLAWLLAGTALVLLLAWWMVQAAGECRPG
jgi:hypothetical protein